MKKTSLQEIQKLLSSIYDALQGLNILATDNNLMILGQVKRDLKTAYETLGAEENEVVENT